MRLDRTAGRGKYAIINLRKLDRSLRGVIDGDLPGSDFLDVKAAMATLERAGLIEYGEPGTENEFFVLKLKDKYAGAALYTYASAVAALDNEFSRDVRELSRRAGSNSPWCKEPD